MTKRPARFLPGWRMLVLCTVVLLVGLAQEVQARHDQGGRAEALVVLCVVCLVRSADAWPQSNVYDADGNPIEIAAVVIWQVRDTANAVYSVGDLTQFLYDPDRDRRPGTSSPATSTTTAAPKTLLGDNADKIARQLPAEVTARVRPSDVDIF